METIPTTAVDLAPSRLRAVNPLADADWNARLEGLPHGGIFHSAEWARVLQNTYGFKPLYFTSTHAGRLESALPMMETNSWLTGKRGISLPFTDHCDPLGSSTSLPALTREVLRHGRESGWKYAEFRGHAGLGDALEQSTPSLSFFGHQLDLRSGADRLFEKFETSVRRAIRKAEKAGLTVEASQTPEAVRAYYALHCRTRRQHGMPPQPFAFFRQIQEQLLARHQGVILSAKHQGRVAASAMFFHHGAEAIYKFAASDPSLQHLRGNNLVIWEAIKRFVAKGVHTLDFGRTSILNEGLRRFKQGWGAEEQRIQYYRFDFRKNTFVTQTDDAFGWHSRVFRNLPLFATRWAGALLYKHVA